MHERFDDSPPIKITPNNPYNPSVTVMVQGNPEFTDDFWNEDIAESNRNMISGLEDHLNNALNTKKYLIYQDIYEFLRHQEPYPVDRYCFLCGDIEEWKSYIHSTSDDFTRWLDNINNEMKNLTVRREHMLDYLNSLKFAIDKENGDDKSAL